MQRVLDALRVIDSEDPPLRESVDLSVLAAEVVRAHCERNSAYTRSEVRIQSSMKLSANPREIEIVLDNLIGNAMKFSTSSPRPQVSVSSSSEPTRTVINVSDNGVGISPEDTDRIFELFERAHTGFEGSGVGLAIVRRIIERHAGKVWARGEPGAGMTVSFYVQKT